MPGIRYILPVLMVFGFALGVLFRSFFDLGWPAALLTIIAGVFLYLFYRLRTGDLLRLCAIFLLALGLGILRYEIKDRSMVSEELKPKIGQRVWLKGVITGEPDERENSTRLMFKNDTGDKILLITGRYPEYFYGDALEIGGILKEPARQSTDSGFDYQAHLAKDDIFLEMIFPEIKKISSGNGSKLKLWLLALKKKYIDGLSRVLPEPQASFISGLTVGAQRSIPKGVMEDFRKSGVIHIIVLSGFHVTTVARAVASIASFLPHFLSVSAGLIGIFLFAILAGASATVVRASIMAAILYFAGLTGRVYQAKIALFAAGLVMILINPKILRFDLGFQLSFLATFGILYLEPYVEKWIKWLPEKFKIRECGRVTISAQAAVTPLLFYAFKTFSLAAVPANLLILSFVPITMFFGFLSGSLSLIHAWLAAPFSWVAYLLSSYELAVASFFANLPFSTLNF